MNIETQGLTKRFGHFTALDSVALAVPAGAIYGLVGPNGAGKTTLIRHLAGVMRPNAGTITMGGQSVYENPAVKQRMLHITDDLYFFPSSNILDMRRFYSQTYHTFDNERFEALQSLFPLDIRWPVRRFSRGMQKQAALWLALCCMPDVVLLDEPMDGLDPMIRNMVWGLLTQDVTGRGTTVLVSSHNLRELEGVCSHVGIMNGGRLVLQRNLGDIQDGLVKLQVAFTGDIPAAMQQLNILHTSQNGQVLEYIIRGQRQQVLEQVRAMNPLLADALPLSLEEIFIYELGGAGYAETVV